MNPDGGVRVAVAVAPPLFAHVSQNMSRFAPVVVIDPPVSVADVAYA